MLTLKKLPKRYHHSDPIPARWSHVRHRLSVRNEPLPSCPSPRFGASPLIVIIGASFGAPICFLLLLSDRYNPRPRTGISAQMQMQLQMPRVR